MQKCASVIHFLIEAKEWLKDLFTDWPCWWKAMQLYIGETSSELCEELKFPKCPEQFPLPQWNNPFCTWVLLPPVSIELRCQNHFFIACIVPWGWWKSPLKGKLQKKYFSSTSLLSDCWRTRHTQRIGLLSHAQGKYPCLGAEIIAAQGIQSGAEMDCEFSNYQV